LSVDQINALPFGAIRLDAEGTVTFYSEAERRLSGFRKEVLGHKFFIEIAPCMDTAEFRGRIDRALAVGQLDIKFGYVGGLPDQPMDLDVRVQSATGGGGFWIFLQHHS
jgi:photoactive yellow protein